MVMLKRSSDSGPGWFREKRSEIEACDRDASRELTKLSNPRGAAARGGVVKLTCIRLYRACGPTIVGAKVKPVANLAETFAEPQEAESPLDRGSTALARRSAFPFTVPAEGGLRSESAA